MERIWEKSLATWTTFNRRKQITREEFKAMTKDMLNFDEDDLLPGATSTLEILD